MVVVDGCVSWYNPIVQAIQETRFLFNMRPNWIELPEQQFWLPCGAHLIGWKMPRNNKGEIIVERIIISCPNCKQGFGIRPKLLERHNNHFCSRKCFHEFIRDNSHAANIEKNEKIRKALSKPKKYYSDFKIKTCLRCGNPFEIFKYSRKRYCSLNCQKAGAREKHSGFNHERWKGGRKRWDIDVEAWTGIAQSIRERDGQKCTRCGLSSKESIKKYGRDLHVHHIIPYELSGDNQPCNLRTLCLPCHKKIEHEFAWIL